MLETSARLLRLLSLFQTQRYWSGAELSERLEVTASTLRRDVDRLRSLGYPVNSTSGAAGGYQLGAGATVPPLLLDDEEAVAVAVGLRTAAGGTVFRRVILRPLLCSGPAGLPARGAGNRGQIRPAAARSHSRPRLPPCTPAASPAEPAAAAFSSVPSLPDASNVWG